MAGALAADADIRDAHQFDRRCRQRRRGLCEFGGLRAASTQGAGGDCRSAKLKKVSSVHGSRILPLAASAWTSLSGQSSSSVQLSTGASRLAALLLAQILPVFSVVAPCQSGAAAEIRCTSDEDRPLASMLSHDHSGDHGGLHTTASVRGGTYWRISNHSSRRAEGYAAPRDLPRRVGNPLQAPRCAWRLSSPPRTPRPRHPCTAPPR